ncbi:amidohydrolase family protein [Thalassoroseus pseudoceratinae]|uniref:amidohydrolase family protein n=1 Tax=Thalassoroseus pseudoceratinae TaxID=2713176 RepID=UPI00142308AA|nr:amidohydrolase family protein [Thalassoroseus pseudoceratinae]
MQRIDSHHHFWHYDPQEYGWIGPDMGVLKRDFLPADLKTEMQANGIEGVVSVQARQTVEETDALLAFADDSEWIRGVVGWVPLAAPDVTDVLARFADRPRLKAVRHVVQDEPDDRFLLRDDFNRGIAALKPFGLVYDILIYAKQLPSTIEFVDRHPEQPFVLDHIAKPTIQMAEFDQTWADLLRELAKRPNVSCKFSGVVTEVRDTEWTVETIRPYWDVALESFGPARLMYGSDWPVCLLRSEYDRWVNCVATLASEMSSDEQSNFWAGNAIRAYGL